MWSSFRLINNAALFQQHEQLVLYCDSTYKVSWEGYPCQVVGFVDKDRRFVIVAYALCHSEKKTDWKFIFGALEEVGIIPSYILGDAAESPMNAAVEVFNLNDDVHYWRLMCYAHVHNVSSSFHFIFS